MHRESRWLGPLLALALLQYISADSVPALVWSNQAPSPEARFSTLVDQIEANDLLGEYAKGNVRVVALVQKDLNVEQFAANDAPFVSAVFDNIQSNPVFFSNVKNPNGVFSSFQSVDQVTTSNSAGGNVVIYLPGKNLKENDETIQLYTEKYNATGPVVFVLTGESNELLREHKRARRDAEKGDTKAEVKFMTSPEGESPCLLLTASDAVLVLTKADSTNPDTITASNPSIDLVTCEDDTNGNRIVKDNVVLKFKTEKGEELKFTWKVQAKASDWQLSLTEVLLGQDKLPLKLKNSLAISSLKAFSFSCSQAMFQFSSDKKYKSGTGTINNFQIQPFYTKTKTDTIRFLDSEDCSVWFTLPIFTSLIIVLLLITILYFGVIALMSISTPDRFENPKGRTLIITNFDE